MRERIAAPKARNVTAWANGPGVRHQPNGALKARDAIAWGNAPGFESSDALSAEGAKSMHQSQT